MIFLNIHNCAYKTLFANPVTYRKVVIDTIFSICNVGMSGLPDMYTKNPRAEGEYIRYTSSAHVTNMSFICNVQCMF